MAQKVLAESSNVPDLLAQAQEGVPRAVARLISMAESTSPLRRELAGLLMAYSGKSRTIGITGPPGVGKSTAVNSLVAKLRETGARVAVLAIDPSSPFSGGALLGDRVRMHTVATDPGVYIRSVSSRGHLGGLALSTPLAVRVLEGVGYEYIVIETVGTGQSEVEIVDHADTTLVFMAPGTGDGVQADKAGILEIGDVYIVNQADRPGSEKLRNHLRQMIDLGNRSADDWKPPVLLTIAQTGEGIADVLTEVRQHQLWLDSTGSAHHRRVRRVRAEIETIALAELRAQQQGNGSQSRLDSLAESVVAGECDPWFAAQALLAGDIGGSP